MAETDELSEYIRATAHHPFTWGEWDCTAWVWRWITDKPLPNWSQEWARNEVHRAGTLASLWREYESVVGIEPVEFPQRGDIAVVSGPLIGHVGAICLGQNYAVKAPDRIMIAKPRLISAWQKIDKRKQV